MNTSDIDLYIEIKKQRGSVWRSAMMMVCGITAAGVAFGFSHWLVGFYSGISLGVLGIAIISVLAKGDREELLDIVQRQIDRDEEAMQYLVTHQTT